MTTKGYFGQFGGSFVPEPIQALLDELEVTFEKYKDDPEFLSEFRHYLKDYSGRVEYVAATDEEAVQALFLLSKTEGIIPAIESSHAIAEAVKRAPKLSKDEIIIINVSGRGDKDVAAIADYLEAKK